MIKTIIKYKGKVIRRSMGCARNAYHYELAVGRQRFSTLAEVKEFINHNLPKFESK
jgi:hypothetical protein